MIRCDASGIDSVRAQINGLAKQVRFATAKALTQTAYEANDEIKKEMRSNIKGGPTAFTLRAFKVTMATPETLTATVALREDSLTGGTSYAKALKHIFTGGGRSWKKLEGWLRGRGILPAGMMIAPGPKAPLDQFGNLKRSAITEMIGVLGSQIRNLRIYRKAGKSGGKLNQKAIGFFICLPGDRSGLTPGIWRRIESDRSVVEPWIMFIRPVAYKRQFDLDQIAKRVVDKVFQENFNRALADAIRTAK